VQAPVFEVVPVDRPAFAAGRLDQVVEFFAYRRDIPAILTGLLGEPDRSRFGLIEVGLVEGSGGLVQKLDHADCHSVRIDDGHRQHALGIEVGDGVELAVEEILGLRVGNHHRLLEDGGVSGESHAQVDDEVVWIGLLVIRGSEFQQPVIEKKQRDTFGIEDVADAPMDGPAQFALIARGGDFG
jgi:hypothetical protein